MYYSKVKKVKSPIRSNKTDAGIDFYVPEFNDSFIMEIKEKNSNSKFAIIKNKIVLMPQQSILIPSGIKVNLTKTKQLTKWRGIMLIVHNKSGISSKKQLGKLAEVIDEEYQGEIHINVINLSDKPQEIFENSKLVQMILEETVYLEPEELPIEDLYNNKSTRGSKGFGAHDNL